MNLIKKILQESFTHLPTDLKTINNKEKHNIDIDTVFKKKYSSELANEVGYLEDNYIKSKGKEKYNASFMDTGIIKTTVSVSKIYPGQKFLSSDTLLNFLNTENFNELPQAVLVKIENKKYIVLLDGHHKVAADMVKGKKSIELLLKVKNYE